MDRWHPCLAEDPSGLVSLRHALVEEYLELVRARARRNTLLAAAYALKFFETAGRDRSR